MSILFHNTMRITDGHLEEFTAAVRRAVAFVEEHGPQLMVNVFLDEASGLVHSFQLYPDSDAVLAASMSPDPEPSACTCSPARESRTLVRGPSCVPPEYVMVPSCQPVIGSVMEWPL